MPEAPPAALDARQALITGASSGIGAELARECAARGFDVILVARTTEALRALAEDLRLQHHVRALVVPQDLAVAGAAERILDAVHREGWRVDVLVNNAGFGAWGPFAEANPATQLAMLQVNVTALTHLTRLVLPEMRARRWGRILNVASTAAFQPGPLMAVYYASKAYVLSFSEALANELAGSGVTVTVLCPGPTATGFSARAGVGHARLFRSKVMGAARVAREGLEAALRGRTVVVPGVQNRVLARLARWLPRKTVTGMVRRIQDDRTP